KIAYNFGTVADTDLILGMHIQHIDMHIFRGDLSRSSFKVKGQIYKIAYNFGTVADTDLILDMPVQHIEVYIFFPCLSPAFIDVCCEWGHPCPMDTFLVRKCGYRP
ncbi:MAG: hypothetical protein ABW185_00970, partial [Sedimenticola sp.]